MTISANTNPSSSIALHNLAKVQRQLDASQKQISTGYVVADAFDNGAVFGVAQLVRSDVAGNAAASSELGNFLGSVQTANAGATAVSNTLSDIRTVLTHLSSSTLTATQFRQYSQQFNTLVASMHQSVAGASYNGTNLLSSSQNFDVLADGGGNNIKVKGGDSRLINFAQTISQAAIDEFTHSAVPGPGNTITNTTLSGDPTDKTTLINSLAILQSILQGLAAGSSVDALTEANFDGYDQTESFTGWRIQASQTTITISGGTGAGFVLSAPVTITLTNSALLGPIAEADSVGFALTNMQKKLDNLAVNQGNLTQVTQDQVAAGAARAQDFLKTDFPLLQNSTSTVLNNIGTLNRAINQQLDFNASIRDALSTGLGSLVDADLAKASAELTATRVKQELATQSLAIANLAPYILVSLFQSTARA